VERGLDTVRSTELTRMDGDAEASLPRNVEGADEVTDLPDTLVACQPVAGYERMAACGRDTRRSIDRFGPEMAYAGDDHSRFNAGVHPGAGNAYPESLGIGLGRQAGAHRVVGRDEELGIDSALNSNLRQIGFGEQRVVFGRAEEGRRLIIGF